MLDASVKGKEVNKMMTGSGAESLCLRSDTEPGYALVNGAGIVSSSPQVVRTITGRDRTVHTTDPYSPVKHAGVPVPGYTAWPPRRNRLGRRYHGLTGGDVLTLAVDKAIKGPKKGFGGLGAFEPGWDDHVGVPPPLPSARSSSGIDWGRIIGQGITAAPAVIQAARGGGAPYGYYNNTGQYISPQGQVIVPGSLETSGALAGAGISNLSASVSNFVAANPLVVLGSGLALVLLFTRPPSRR